MKKKMVSETQKAMKQREENCKINVLADLKKHTRARENKGEYNEEQE